MSITKNSGMVFEQVCKRLLEQKGYSVYPLKSYPNLYECGLKKQDLGIDLIAVNDKHNIAVQCVNLEKIQEEYHGKNFLHLMHYAHALWKLRDFRLNQIMMEDK